MKGTSRLVDQSLHKNILRRGHVVIVPHYTSQNVQEKAGELEQTQKERDRYADQMQRLQTDAAMQSKTIQKLENQAKNSSAVPTSKVCPNLVPTLSHLMLNTIWQYCPHECSD